MRGKEKKRHRAEANCKRRKRASGRELVENVSFGEEPKLFIYLGFQQGRMKICIGKGNRRENNEEEVVGNEKKRRK